MASSADALVTTKPVAVMTVDDDGRQLSYPYAVFFDPAEEEIYLVNGGSARVVVYGPDFFPRVSIGAGRSIGYPRGVHVTKNGQVYICQGVNRSNPVRRITILNGAFFVDREIFLDEIPEAEGFSPRQLAISRDGLIYLTSDQHRGVMVLDREGNFLRWLKPMDMISNRQAIAEAARELEEQEKALQAAEESSATEGARPDIPEEFRPRSKAAEGEEGASGPGLGAVKVQHVSIDSAGNIYLLSSETSKVYVYNSDESFLFSFGEKGGTPRKMSQPRSLAIDENAQLIYVADYTRHTVLVYDMAGTYLYEFGGRGFKPGFFNFPTSVALNRQGHVIVADLFNKRVQVLEVKYEGGIPKFGASPQSESAESSEEGGSDEGSPIVIEEGEGTEGDSGAEAPAQPEDAVEEEIIPAEDFPVSEDPDSTQEPVETPPDQPAIEVR